jgi:hypothetical protein
VINAHESLPNTVAADEAERVISASEVC